LPLDLVALRDEALEPLLDAREVLAEAAQRFRRQPLRLVGLAILALRLAEGIGRRIVGLARRRDLRIERGLPLLETARRIVQRFELTLEIVEPSLERADLRLSALSPARPVGGVGGNLAQSPQSKLRRRFELTELQPGLVGGPARLVEMRPFALRQRRGLSLVAGFLQCFLRVG